MRSGVGAFVCGAVCLDPHLVIGAEAGFIIVRQTRIAVWGFAGADCLRRRRRHRVAVCFLDYIPVSAAVLVAKTCHVCGR